MTAVLAFAAAVLGVVALVAWAFRRWGLDEPTSACRCRFEADPAFPELGPILDDFDCERHR